jgi:hypothetical protein
MLLQPNAPSCSDKSIIRSPRATVSGSTIITLPPGTITASTPVISPGPGQQSADQHSIGNGLPPDSRQARTGRLIVPCYRHATQARSRLRASAAAGLSPPKRTAIRMSNSTTRGPMGTEGTISWQRWRRP